MSVRNSKKEKYEETTVLTNVKTEEKEAPSKSITLDASLKPTKICLDDDLLKANAFIVQLYRAFASHSAIVLNPNNLWILITQGISQLINLNPKKFQGLIIKDTSKKCEVRLDTVEPDTIKSQTNEIIEMFTNELKQHLTDFGLTKLQAVQCGPQTLAQKSMASVVCFAASVHYIDFVLYTFCGIPRVELEGSAKDWEALVNAVIALDITKNFDAPEWDKALTEVVQKISESYKKDQSDIDIDWWKSIFKLNSQSGTDTIDGWCQVFFPIIFSKERNPEMAKCFDQTRDVDVFPFAVSNAPFQWKYFDTNIPMNFHAAFQCQERDVDGALILIPIVSIENDQDNAKAKPQKRKITSVARPDRFDLQARYDEMIFYDGIFEKRTTR